MPGAAEAAALLHPVVVGGVGQLAQRRAPQLLRRAPEDRPGGRRGVQHRPRLLVEHDEAVPELAEPAAQRVHRLRARAQPLHDEAHGHAGDEEDDAAGGQRDEPEMLVEPQLGRDEQGERERRRAEAPAQAERDGGEGDREDEERARRLGRSDRAAQLEREHRGEEQRRRDVLGPAPARARRLHGGEEATQGPPGAGRERARGIPACAARGARCAAGAAAEEGRKRRHRLVPVIDLRGGATHTPNRGSRRRRAARLRARPEPRAHRAAEGLPPARRAGRRAGGGRARESAVLHLPTRSSTWECWTTRWRSSPARRAASAARRPSCSPSTARRW